MSNTSSSGINLGGLETGTFNSETGTLNGEHLYSSKKRKLDQVNRIDITNNKIKIHKLNDYMPLTDPNDYKPLTDPNDKPPTNPVNNNPPTKIPNPPNDKAPTNQNQNQNPPKDNPMSIIFFFNELNKLNKLDDDINNNDTESEDDDFSIPVEVECDGKFCDHDSQSPNIRPIPERFMTVDDTYTITLDDLIELGLCYHCQLQTTFRTISLKKLAKLVTPLEKLKMMIGMSSIKSDFVEQVVNVVQGFEKNQKELLHTIIEGPPGVGKTHVVDILAEIYIAMGYMTKNIIKKVRRSDLIGKYLGHTADKTQKAINEAEGGILLIDEAYSLGNEEKRDSFSKECIDTINQNLSERSDKFICIIIGYEKELDKCFFAYNPGLRSRFKHKYTIEGYEPSELQEIFDLKIQMSDWYLDPNIDKKQKLNFFIKNKAIFKYFGRSMETLLFHTKIAHSNRVFWETDPSKKKY